MSILTIKLIKTTAIDPEEGVRKEQSLARLIVLAAKRRWEKKRSALADSKHADAGLSKDHLDSDSSSAYEKETSLPARV